ncbi:MAG: LysR substrate-binding domain-containing protein [Burkholderiales bacterium]
MDANSLRTFLIVADELHFGRAASRLNITASPLTRRIQKMEDEYGVLLFKRTKRSVTLTAAGALMVMQARSLLAAADNLPGMLRRAARGEIGILRVGSIGTALFSPIGELQAKMRRSLPDVRLVWQVMSSSELVQAVRQDQLDLALVSSPIEHDGLMLQQVHREPLVAILPSDHPFAQRRSISLRELRNETFAISSREQVPNYFDRFIGACHAAGFEPKLEQQPQSIVIFLGLVAIGAAVTIGPASLGRVRVEGVSYVKLHGVGLFNEISMIWNARNLSPVLALALKLMGAPRFSNVVPTRTNVKRLTRVRNV